MVRPATDQLIAMLQGKIIGITGTIELYQGKPEIKVMSILEQTKPLTHLACWPEFRVLFGFHRLKLASLSLKESFA